MGKAASRRLRWRREGEEDGGGEEREKKRKG
jgi:hypothetical protein